MKRVLVISPVPTHPVTAGNRARIAQLAAAMRARGAVLDCLYYAIDGVDADAIAAMQGAWDRVYVAAADRFARRAHDGRPWRLDEWIGPAPLLLAERLAASVGYDAVIANYVWCSALLDPFTARGACGVIDAHDAFGDRLALLAQAGVDPHWFYTTPEEEGRGFDRADVVVAIQRDEAARFAERTWAEVHTVEFAPAPVALPVSAGRRIAVGYIGSNNPLNRASVARFDALVAAHPARAALLERYDFRLYGPVCEAGDRYRIWRPIGVVAAPQDAYRAVRLVVNPMVGGTGLKVKTVEALAYGRPVLATRAGGAGIGHLHPDLTLDDPAAIVARLAELDGAAIDALATAMTAAYAGFHAETQARLAALIDRIGL